MDGYTELHRHLDVSLRLSTLLELAQDQGLESLGSSLESFRKKIVVSQPLKNLREVLDRFSLFQKVLSDPQIFERVAYEVIEDCYYEGIRKVELRFSPDFMCAESKIPWEEALAALNRGKSRALSQYPEIQAGFIAIASRDFGLESVEKTIEFFLTHPQDFIGLDLAGNEDEFPCSMFQEAFKPVRSRDLNITIHAGEASGPENVWEAIELLGAKRIGHGIAAAKDPKLMDYLREKSICLENCPTSNWITGAVSNFESHPLPLFLKAGVPVSINTDDPAIFGVSLPGEFEVAREKMGLSDPLLGQCQAYAQKASFIKD